jgi:hypothetical protein
MSASTRWLVLTRGLSKGSSIPCCSPPSRFLQVLNNVWRMCRNYVDPRCLLEQDADLCVAQDIKRLLAAPVKQAQPGALPAGAVAGIVVSGGCRAACMPLGHSLGDIALQNLLAAALVNML